MKYAGWRLSAVLCVVSCAGCGDGRLNVKGQIVRGGSAFTVPVDDFVRVTFLPVTADGKEPSTSYIAAYDNDAGTFKALGADLAGVPPGQYRIMIAHERKRRDLFKGAYDFKRSPYVFDISSSNQEIVIDLDRPAGTGQAK